MTLSRQTLDFHQQLRLLIAEAYRHYLHNTDEMAPSGAARFERILTMLDDYRETHTHNPPSGSDAHHAVVVASGRYHNLDTWDRFSDQLAGLLNELGVPCTVSLFTNDNAAEVDRTVENIHRIGVR